MEFHGVKFVCTPCKKEFKWKQSFVRHSLECRNAIAVYTCNQCDYFSFRKYNLQRHNLDQHTGNPVPSLDEATEKPVPSTHMCANENFPCIFLGGEKSVIAFNVGSKVTRLGSLSLPFEVKGLTCHNDFLIVIGSLECHIKSITLNNDSIHFGDKATISIDSSV